MDTMTVAARSSNEEENMATTGVQQATLTVWKFPTATGAAEAAKTVKTLHQEALINLLDAAIVSWPDNRAKPITQEFGRSADTGALTGSYWGCLLGLRLS